MSFMQLTDKHTGELVCINLELVTEFFPLAETSTRFYQAVEIDGERAHVDVRESYGSVKRYIDTWVAPIYNAALQIASWQAERDEQAVPA